MGSCREHLGSGSTSQDRLHRVKGDCAVLNQKDIHIGAFTPGVEFSSGLPIQLPGPGWGTLDSKRFLEKLRR